MEYDDEGAEYTLELDTNEDVVEGEAADDEDCTGGGVYERIVVGAALEEDEEMTGV